MAHNTSEDMLTYRISRRSLLVGLAGFTSLSALLAACSSTDGNTPIATATPSSVGSSPTSATLSPTSSPAQSPTTIPASGPIGATLFEYHGHPSGAFAIAWSPDGTLIASGGSDKTAQVWSALTGETRLVYHGHSDQVNSVNWSPDGRLIASRGGCRFGRRQSPDRNRVACGTRNHDQAMWRRIPAAQPRRAPNRRR